MANNEVKPSHGNEPPKGVSKTWEAAMRLKGSVVVNDASLYL